ncbi:MAG: EamA family transporter, partial [Alistipes sp.]|nr:EamA family transporter [Alistipes sp.]
LVALVVRIFANPAASLFRKKLTLPVGGRPDGADIRDGNDPSAVNLMTYLVLSAACVPWVPGVDWGAMPREFWWNCLLVGLFGGVGNAYVVKALQCGELSVLGPVNSWKSVVGMAVGVVVLGEIPGLWGLVGVALIIGGSYFVLVRTGERFSWRLLGRRDIRYRMWAMILTAVEAVFIKQVIVLSSTGVSFIIWCWFGGVMAAAVAMVSGRGRRRREMFSFRAGDLPLYLGVAACVGLSQYSTNVVFAGMDVGYALALFQLSAVVSVFLGWKVFSEGGIARKLIGSAIMIAGSVVIILLN